jgi:hypothetical protein
MVFVILNASGTQLVLIAVHMCLCQARDWEVSSYRWANRGLAKVSKFAQDATVIGEKDEIRTEARVTSESKTQNTKLQKDAEGPEVDWEVRKTKAAGRLFWEAKEHGKSKK